jgi:hypothetical protein
MRTPRPHAWTRRAAASTVVALVGLVSLSGCDPRTLFYFLQPEEPMISPPGPELEGKKVVVVTQSVGGGSSEFMNIDRDVTRDVSSILREKVKKIQVVDSEKIATWIEAHPKWTSAAELAKAFEADIVIQLEIEAFQVQNPGDLNVLQGTAKTHVMVTEMAYPKNDRGKPIKDKPKEGKVAYDEYVDTEFPTRGPIPADAGPSRNSFKNKFLKIVASEISWHFVPHSAQDQIQDVKFNVR